MAAVDRRIQGDAKLRKNNNRRFKDRYEKSLSVRASFIFISSRCRESYPKAYSES